MENPAAGIASQLMAPEGQGQPVAQEQAIAEEGVVAQESGAGVDDSAVTPDEQKAFDEVSAAAMKVIFEDDDSNAKILKGLQEGADNPASTVAQIVLSLFGQIDEQGGGKMPVSIMYGVVEDIADQVLELAEASGAMMIDENTKGQIAQEIIAKFGTAYDIPPEEIEALTASLPQEEVDSMVAQQEQIAGGSDVQVQ